jgi:hypothetical protein
VVALFAHLRDVAVESGFVNMQRHRCVVCELEIEGEPLWINPLKGLRTSRREQSIHTAASVGTAESGPGYVPYHRDCAAERFPDIDLD